MKTMVVRLLAVVVLCVCASASCIGRAGKSDLISAGCKQLQTEEACKYYRRQCDWTGEGTQAKGFLPIRTQKCGPDKTCKANKDRKTFWTCRSPSMNSNPKAGVCLTECNGKQGCQDMTYQDKPNWRIRCGSGEDVCSNVTGAIPAENKLVCDSRLKACYNSEFICPSGETCELTCNGKEACKDARFRGAWRVSCQSGKDVCTNIRVDRFVD